MRSGYPDGPLALGVLGCQRSETRVRLLELVGPLDGNPQRPGLQQSREPLQVLLTATTATRAGSSNWVFPPSPTEDTPRIRRRAGRS
jgi:hypothetical protein